LGDTPRSAWAASSVSLDVDEEDNSVMEKSMMEFPGFIQNYKKIGISWWESVTFLASSFEKIRHWGESSESCYDSCQKNVN
jgi:hypothetical protein